MLEIGLHVFIFHPNYINCRDEHMPVIPLKSSVSHTVAINKSIKERKSLFLTIITFQI